MQWTQMILRIEETVNRLNDNKWAWFPMFWLRPAASELMTPELVLILTVCVFTPLSLAAAIAIWFYAGSLGFEIFGQTVIAICAFVFPLTGAVSFQYISAHFWNRRVRRLIATGKTEASPAKANVILSNNIDSNPYRTPLATSVATQRTDGALFPLSGVMYAHEVLFCYGSLLVFAAFLLWQQTQRLGIGRAYDFRLPANVLIAQAVVLLMLTLGLAKRQTWLGRRVFFALKLILGAAQVIVCSLPAVGSYLRLTGVVWPAEDIVLLWFLCCGVLVVASAIIQFQHPRPMAAPMFSRADDEKDTGNLTLPEFIKQQSERG